MNKPTFFEGVVIALAASIAGSALVHLATRIFPSTALLQLLITVCSFAYIIYLLLRSQERSGRLTIIAVWFALSIAGLVFTPSLLTYTLAQLGMIWLIRSLYYYNSLLIALADLGLTGLSVAIAIWTWTSTYSVFLSLWCFLLTQALFALFPADMPRLSNKPGSDHINTSSTENRFEQAYHSANSAIRKIATRPVRH